MLTDTQIITFLNKKYFGVADTEGNRRPFEEPFPAKQLVFNTQIFSQTIPVINPLNFSFPSGTINGVIQVFVKESLFPVPGAPNAFYSPALIDSIPFNYSSNGTYNYELFKNNGIDQIGFGVNDWIVDNSGGTLRFFNGMPAGVSSGSPPKISFYKYIGTKGVSSGTLNSINNAGGSFGYGLFKNLTGGGSTANFYNINTVHPGITISLDAINDKYDFSLVLSAIDHNSLSGLLTGDPHTQYAALAGRNSQQTLIGATTVQGNLVLQSTSHPTRGAVVVTDRLRINSNNGKYGAKKIINTTGVSPIVTLTLNSTDKQYITLNITIAVWNTITDDMENCIGAYGIKTDAFGIVTIIPIMEKIINNNFSFSTGTNTFIVNYNGNIGDVASWVAEWVFTGPNHVNDIVSIM
jgi:hypothetical protein